MVWMKERKYKKGFYRVRTPGILLTELWEQGARDRETGPQGQSVWLTRGSGTTRHSSAVTLLCGDWRRLHGGLSIEVFILHLTLTRFFVGTGVLLNSREDHIRHLLCNNKREVCLRQTVYHKTIKSFHRQIAQKFSRKFPGWRGKGV